MAKRKSDYPMQKVTLNLYEGDMDRLMTLYPKFGAGRIIRELVRAHLNKIDAQLNQPEVELHITEVLP